MKTLLSHPVVVLVFRLGLAGIFFVASLDKIIHAEAFSDSIVNYHILPDVTINVWALWLPWLEFLLAVLLVIGVWTRAASATALVLLVVFLIAIIQGLIRGIDFHCGCFTQGGKSADAASWWTVGRDGLFLLLPIGLLLGDRGDSLKDLWRRLNSLG